MSSVITDITSSNKHYPYTVYLLDNILHVFKRKHIVHATKSFSFETKKSKKGKETTIEVVEQVTGKYALQMASCTGEYDFKDEVYVNDYLVKKVKLYTCEKKGDRWQKFIQKTKKREGFVLFVELKLSQQHLPSTSL